MFKYSKYLTEKEAFNLEIRMINIIGRKNMKTGPLSNMTNGGDGICGRIVTQEMRETYRRINIGKNNPFYGRHHTEDYKRKKSNAQKGKNSCMFGKHLSEKTKKKISLAGKGRRHTEETKKKISESQRGSKHHLFGKITSQKTKDKIMRKNGHPVIIDGKYYYSIREAGRDLKIDNKTVWSHLKNKNFPNYKYVSAT